MSPSPLWPVVLAAAAALQLPAVLQTCISDEAQAGTRVVRTEARGPTGPWWREASPGHRRAGQKTETTPQPIRIRGWISPESSGLSEAERRVVEAAVGEAVGRVSGFLSVDRGPAPLLLNRDAHKYCKFVWRNSSSANYNRCARANASYRRETCLDVTIPDDHLAGCSVYPEADSPRRTELRPDGAGVPDADFLLYLHIKSTDKCRAEANVLAYAVHCQTGNRGRPVAGVVVICKDRLAGGTYSHQSTVQTLIHELLHALGFSKHLFNTWRDCSLTSPGGDDCPPRGKVIHADGSGQMRIYSPSTISALQAHLVSTDPELGAPLENLGAAPGRASSHWESRVLRGSIMAPVLGDPVTVRIDPVTLAALQDTGWYTVDLSRAQSLVWGSGEGRLFGSISTCRENSSFFCTGSGLGCHYLHFHKGACQTDPYLEGCRVYEPLKKRSECWKEENSQNSTGPNWSDELFGSDSRCFFSSLTRKTQTVWLNSTVEGRCYRHRCTGPNRYQVQVFGSGWVDCPAGGAIQVDGYHGAVFCPDGRLCQRSAPPPPSENASTFPASITRQVGLRPHPRVLPTPPVAHTGSSISALPPTTEPDPIPAPPPPRSALPLLWSSWPPRPFPGSGSPAGSGSILPQGILPTCSKPEDNMLAN
ncbi:leishmanolysin-like peptidase 2 isoform X3 [Takifugu rubripes]|uniref:leishmanolysin-like peptidase 2 isoform X3 n=1 Tax=Takifugu rubripes TaxID=31033 RepID=UPI0011452CDA|nr:leishmanolysin-like peptidase 2 isoform X3 [Takifugu rubripes]